MDITTIPSGDHVFARTVRDIAQKEPATSTALLQAALRPIYPRIALVRSQVSGQADTIYAYRDGALETEPPDDWWRGEDVAHARVSASTGKLVAVGEGWEDIFGDERAELVGRHFSEMVHPGALAAAQALFEALKHHAEVRSTIMVRRADGSAANVDSLPCAMARRSSCITVPLTPRDLHEVNGFETRGPQTHLRLEGRASAGSSRAAWADTGPSVRLALLLGESILLAQLSHPARSHR